MYVYLHFMLNVYIYILYIQYYTIHTYDIFDTK